MREEHWYQPFRPVPQRIDPKLIEWMASVRFVHHLREGDQ